MLALLCGLSLAAKEPDLVDSVFAMLPDSLVVAPAMQRKEAVASFAH